MAAMEKFSKGQSGLMNGWLLTMPPLETFARGREGPPSRFTVKHNPSKFLVPERKGAQIEIGKKWFRVVPYALRVGVVTADGFKFFWNHVTVRWSPSRKETRAFQPHSLSILVASK